MKYVPEQCPKHGQQVIGDLVNLKTGKTIRPACESCAAEYNKTTRMLRSEDERHWAVQFRLVGR